jgi:mitochondrial inner membrane protease ATP23
MVKFMLEQLSKTGCPFEKRHFILKPCDPTMSGGFAPSLGIILCQNQMMNRQHMEDTMVHEVCCFLLRILLYDQRCIRLN